MNPEELRALADRCEREAPSIELEADVARGCGWTVVSTVLMEPEELGVPVNVGCPPGSEYQRHVPRLLESVDAAVTLVPAECVWSVDNLAGPAARIIGGTPEDGWDVYSDHAETRTPALALCAAALRARAHTQTQGGE